MIRLSYQTRFATALLAGLMVAIGWAGLAPAAKPQPPGLPNTNLLGLTYTPLPEWVPFEDKATVQKWVDENDTKSMTIHAWQVWAGLTEKVNQAGGVPLFETWFDPPQVFGPPPAPAAMKATPVRLFTVPRQSLHRNAAELQAARQTATAAPIPPPPPPTDPLNFRLVTVKYNLEMRDHAQANKYYDPGTLQKINSGWGTTPIADRNLKPYPDRSVMLKPVYQIISGTEASLVPYWAGQDHRLDQSKPPGPSNWSEKMLVIPDGLPKLNIRGIPTVGLDRFYHVKLTETVSKYVNAIIGANPPVKAGDYAILTGMHVSTREIDNWTWQTFWWSLTPPVIPAVAAKHIKAPFDNYEVQVGYSFMNGPARGKEATEGNPNSLPVVCFNPYLEAGFGNSTFAPLPNQLGIESNCMSCHRAAAWPGNTASYVSNGIIRTGDPYFFTGNTKSDFVWGQTDVNPPPPSK